MKRITIRIGERDYGELKRRSEEDMRAVSAEAVYFLLRGMGEVEEDSSPDLQALKDFYLGNKGFISESTSERMLSQSEGVKLN